MKKLVLILLAAAIYGCNKNNLPAVKLEPIDLAKVEASSIELYMVGDALIHGAVYEDAKTENGYDFSDMIDNFRSIITECDLCYYNQETIFGGENLGYSSYPRFNTPEAFGDNMLDLGFNLVSLANNHSLDKNEEGIIHSMEYWSSKDAVISGTFLSDEARNKINIYEKNGISYAFLSYTYGTNGLNPPDGKEYLVNVYNDEMLINDIRNVRDKVDIVIVAMHWGLEYDNNFSSEQERLANLLASEKVDIVIGAHPHVIQPVVHIGDTIVYYSLGNFISAQDTTNKRIGMIGGITINKKVIDGEVVIDIDNPRADLFYTYYDDNIRNFKLYMFNQLDDSLLNNYEKIYEEYKKIITRHDDSIKIGLE